MKNYSLKDPLGLEISDAEVSTTIDDSQLQRLPSAGNITLSPIPIKRKRSSNSQNSRPRSKSKSQECCRSEDDTRHPKKKRRRSHSVDKINRLDVSFLIESKPSIDRYQYGNYRLPKSLSCDVTDQRLTILKRFHKLFEDKRILDVGCGTGDTIKAMAVEFSSSNFLGIDRDSSLIRSANNSIRRREFSHLKIVFRCQNFVPSLAVKNSNVLPPSVVYDCILLLSVSKWIHLTHGDEGLIQTFHKIYQQLPKGGVFVFEPQLWPSYSKSRKINDAMFRNFNSIKLFPQQFPNFLVNNCSFSCYHHIGEVIRRKRYKTYKRPIFLFYKL